MSLPRPVVIGLAGVVAVAGLFLYTQSQRREGVGASKAARAANAKVSKDPGGKSATAPGHGSPSRARSRAGSGGGAKPVAPAGPGPLSIPQPVARALAQHKVVVVLFWSRRGADDRAVKAAVDRLPGSVLGSPVAVFQDSPGRVARYSLVASGVGVSQSPTLVIVDRARRARVVSGFIDYDSIVQMVRDAGRVSP